MGGEPTEEELIKLCEKGGEKGEEGEGSGLKKRGGSLGKEWRSLEKGRERE